MPLHYLRRLTGRKRSEAANRHLARYLAFVAGAANAGGYFAVRQYTSHMSGVLASMADNVAIGSLPPAGIALASVGAFFLGSFFTTLFVRWARTRALECEYALPLVAEAALLLFFGLEGRAYSAGKSVLGWIVLLCFSMGLQNAIITKLSGSVIRTTHVTGMVTDLGIAIGRIVFGLLQNVHVSYASEVNTLRLLGSLVALFLAGGVTGALGFRLVGSLFAVPLSLVLLLLAGVPVVDDMRGRENVSA